MGLELLVCKTMVLLIFLLGKIFTFHCIFISVTSPPNHCLITTGTLALWLVLAMQEAAVRGEQYLSE